MSVPMDRSGASGPGTRWEFLRRNPRMCPVMPLGSGHLTCPCVQLHCWTTSFLVLRQEYNKFRRGGKLAVQDKVTGGDLGFHEKNQKDDHDEYRQAGLRWYHVRTFGVKAAATQTPCPA